MPLTRMKGDYIISDGVKFWMADEQVLQLICDRKHHVGSPGLCSGSDVAVAKLGRKVFLVVLFQ